jgi:glycosyltransferase involved in cell wall biosynthesis
MPNNDTPLVSVVMAVWNGMPYLSEAVESVLAQTMRDFEFIVINDGSTDETERYLGGLADSRLRIFSQPNAGVGASANRGIALARGRYVARMDADDVSLPTRLERQVQFLRENPEVALVGTQFAFLSRGRIVEAPSVPTKHAEIVRRFLGGRIGIPNSSIMCDARLAKETPYRMAGAGEDVDFCLRLAAKGRCANLTEMLQLYRIHLESLSLSAADEMQRGQLFAIQSARSRQSGGLELSFEAFCERWARRGCISRIRGGIQGWGFCQYRKSILDRAAGNRLRSSVRLCLAGACRPVTGARRLLNLVHRVSGRLGAS